MSEELITVDREGFKYFYVIIGGFLSQRFKWPKDRIYG